MLLPRVIPKTQCTGVLEVEINCKRRGVDVEEVLSQPRNVK